MSPVSIARPHLSWVALFAITTGISACGGGSGAGPTAPVGNGTSTEEATVVPSGGSGSSSTPSEASNNGGTLSDGSNQPGGEGNLPVAQEQGPDLDAALDVDANAEDLNDVAADLRRRFIDDARRSLVGVNRDYVSGTLEQSKFFCFDDNFPVTDYSCGGDDRSLMLTAYGSELVGFTYTNTEECTGPLVAQGVSDNCSLEFTEINYGDTWRVIYRLRELDFELFQEVRVSDRTAENGSEACEITYGTASETFYSDDAICDRILRSVATAASGS